MIGACSECGQERPIQARGLCHTCYTRAWRKGLVQRPQQRLTIPELHRMKALADAGMPCGSIAIALRVDFGVDRTGDNVRGFLRRHYDWHSSQRRGKPFSGPRREVEA